MFVLGTAGHVDHGKSSLLRALTGMEPDRLPEEKKRGMTIDLNFVWLASARGVVGIVDVPGHRRFVKSMISGVQHVDAFLFVVAADDGWMLQSEEHLQVLQGLGIRRGIAVITKTDLVDEAHRREVEAEVSERMAHAFGPGVPLVRFSTAEPTTTETVKAALETLLGTLPSPADGGPGRLWIDRVFLPKGLGVVVTGTLREGPLREGDTVALWPSGLSAQVKSLQSYHRSVQQARPVARVAVQLSGVSAASVSRGMLLQRGGGAAVTKKLVARVTFFRAAPRRIVEMGFHVGTSHTGGRVVPLQASGDSREIFCKIHLAEPRPLRTGDAFVLRTAGEEKTLGAGIVVDAAPGALTHRALLEGLLEWENTPEAFLRLEALKSPLVDVTALAPRAGHDLRELSAVLRDSSRYIALEPAVFVETALWKRLGEVAVAALKEHGRKSSEPLGEGDLIRHTATALGLPHRSVQRLLRALVDNKIALRETKGYRLSGAPAVVDGAESRRRERVLKAVRNGTREPVCLRDFYHGARDLKNSAHHLAREGVLVALGDDFFAESVDYVRVRDRVVTYLKENGQGPTAALRDYLGTSRKNAVLWLEQLDRDRITFLKDNVRRLFKP